MILFRYHCEIETEPLEHRFNDHASGSMQRRINDTQRLRLTNDRWIQNERFESVHVRFVDLLADRFYLTLSVSWQRGIGFGRDRVHFCNDPTGVRLDYLRAVGEVNFVAIIVWWIVTRCDHPTRAGLEITNGK